MKKTILHFAIILSLVTLMGGLQSCAGTSSEKSLNGNWVSSDGVGLTISGSNATFYSFNSTWQLFVDEGMVSVGTLKMKNISQVNATTWNCLTLWNKLIDGVPDSTAWSVDGTIVMSADGNSITISASSPFTGTAGSVTHTRVQ